MRKHHNKLYYGKYRFKNVFKMPWAGILYPTTDQKLLEMIQGKDKNVRYLNTTWYKSSPDVVKLAKFILDLSCINYDCWKYLSSDAVSCETDAFH